MQELNALTSIIGSIRADNAQDREAWAAARSASAQEKVRRKQLAAEAFQVQKSALQPKLIAIVDKLASRDTPVQSVWNADLIDLLKYFFDDPPTGLSKLKNPELVAAVEERLETFRATRAEV